MVVLKIIPSGLHHALGHDEIIALRCILQPSMEEIVTSVLFVMLAPSGAFNNLVRKRL